MTYERNIQARNNYVAPHNIECYKCHNYGHIARNCRSIIKPSMKENIDERHKKVWRRSCWRQKSLLDCGRRKSQCPSVYVISNLMG
jgi:hypothetical protein